MKRTLFFLFLTLNVLLAACTRSASPGPTQTPAGTDILEEFFRSASITVTSTRTLPPMFTSTPGPTEPPGSEETAQPSATQAEPQPTTPASTDAPAAASATSGPAGPTPTPKPSSTATPLPTSEVPPIDPDALFGDAAHYVETFDNPVAWRSFDGTLPDTANLQLQIEDGEMRVTGKLNEWDTWWFGGSTQTDFYMEMDVETGSCSGTDAYGLIVRGAPSNAEDPSHGYIVAFTCEGKVFARRLDSSNPYSASQILLQTATGSMVSGPNQTNTIGIHFEDDALTIYVNRQYFTVLYDNTFAFGRWGIFVKAGPDGNYTFLTPEIRVWDLVE